MTVKQSFLSGVAATASASLVVCMIAGCGGQDGQPLVPRGAENTPAPRESIVQGLAPRSRSMLLTQGINAYRRQTYGIEVASSDASVDVKHHDVLYTAAYRHAVNVNSRNAGNQTAKGGEAVDIVVDGDTELEDFFTDTVAGSGGLFPAFYTHEQLDGRVRAVAGAKNLVGNNDKLMEGFLFSGTVNSLSNSVSEFKGYSISGSNLGAGTFPRDALSSLWYSVRGRVWLSEYSLTHIGIAGVSDDPYATGVVAPRPPILDGRFVGSVVGRLSQPRLARLGHWPKSLQEDVNTTGTDWDTRLNLSSQSATAQATLTSTSGPPIHVTLPVDEVFETATAGADGIRVMFRRMSIDPNGRPQGPRGDGYSQSYIAYWRAEPGRTLSYYPVGGGVGGAFESGYDYSAESWTGVNLETEYQLPNGMLIIMPCGPLEPNTWYEVGVRLRTLSFTLEGTTTTDNPAALYRWTFKTNSR